MKAVDNGWTLEFREAYRRAIARLFKEKKEEQKTMAKKTSVKFKMRDGVKPYTDGACLSLRAPLGFKVMVGGTITVDLGLSCYVPLLVFDRESLREKKITIESGTGVVDAGVPLRLVLKNSGKEPYYFEAGELLAKALPFVSAAELEVEAE
jgi:hypothetical protein